MSLPVAVPGDDVTVSLGSTVTLDASNSYSPNLNALTYAWTLISAPIGSSATLLNSADVSPSITLDVQGDYQLSLVVNDGINSSLVSVMTITSIEALKVSVSVPELANASDLRFSLHTVPIGPSLWNSTITFDGTGYADFAIPSSLAESETELQLLISTYEGNNISSAIVSAQVASISPVLPTDTFVIAEGDILQQDLALLINEYRQRLNLSRVVPDVYHYGAVGDGVTLDTAALKAAFQPIFGPATPTYLLNLGELDDAVFLVDEPIIWSDLTSVIIKGRGTIKRADNMIVNVDGDAANFIPLIRIQGAPSVEFSGAWKIDGNRVGQVYPATANLIGRGSKPWRHNAEIEITPDASETVCSSHIRIDFGGVSQTYLNGLALWQVKDAKITGGTFSDTTWNGITGAGGHDVSISSDRCYFSRCASYDMFDSNRVQGDRAGIQFRELAIDFTTQTEGLPTIRTGEFENGGINQGLSITGCVFEECSVESVYVRAGFNCTVSNNKSINTGYKRLDADGRYYPSHIWLESGSYTCIGNTLIQTQHLHGDMPPDGIRITTLGGDATHLYPASGQYFSVCKNNTIRSSKDPETGESHRYFHYGIRTNGDCKCDDNTIDGTHDWPIWVQNGASHPGETVPKNFSADGCVFDNVPTDNNAVIYISKFERDELDANYFEVTGDVENISAKGCSVPAGMGVLRFNNNLSEHQRVNISHGIGDIFSRYTETSLIDIAVAAKEQLPHGLGEFPKLVYGILVCQSSQGGWQTGDHVPVSSLLSDGSSMSGDDGIGISIGYDAVNITVIMGSQLEPLKLLNRSNPTAPENIGESFDLDFTKWKLLVRAFV